MDLQSSLTVPEALEKLATHGDASQIAAHLEQECVVGLPGSAAQCVIAEYVKAQTNAQIVEVMPTGVCVCDFCKQDKTPGRVEWVGSDGLSAGVRLSQELDRLAKAFDHGHYPQLEVKK